MLTHKPVHACHVDVLKMGPSRALAMKMAAVLARMGLQVKSVTDVPSATGDSLLMAARVSA